MSTYHCRQNYNIFVQGQFSKAMELVGRVFLDRALYYKNSWLPARTVVEEALANRLKVYRHTVHVESAICHVSISVNMLRVWHILW